MPILYEGPSTLDGAPIVAIAPDSVSNTKTGGMLQTYILRADVNPFRAVHTGADVSICGDCPRRGIATGVSAVGRTCYVNLLRGPAPVWNAYAAGRYALAQDLGAVGAGRAVRLGAYGDPAAVPMDVWRALLSRADGWTGYTHQWRRAPELRPYLMASADTEAEAIEARAAGWRTFRVRERGEPLMVRESTCPASAEAGRKLQCIDCRACDGAGSGRRGSITIIRH